MKLRTQLFILVIGAIAVFAFINWSLFISPTILSLGFYEVEAPLGLVMLGVIIFLIVMFLVFALYMQWGALIDTYRHSRDLKLSQVLAEKTETSRFTELREIMEVEIRRQESNKESSNLALMTRLDKLERELCAAIEKTAATISSRLASRPAP